MCTLIQIVYVIDVPDSAAWWWVSVTESKSEVKSWLNVLKGHRCGVCICVLFLIMDWIFPSPAKKKEAKKKLNLKVRGNFYLFYFQEHRLHINYNVRSVTLTPRSTASFGCCVLRRGPCAERWWCSPPQSTASFFFPPDFFSPPFSNVKESAGWVNSTQTARTTAQCRCNHGSPR